MRLQRSKYCAPVLFFVFVLLGICIYKDYGISWDEEQQHNIGAASYEYVFHGNDELFRIGDKDYGVAFELPLIMLEKGLGLTEKRDIFLMRHISTHLLFLAGAWAFFLLIRLLLRNDVLSILGLLLYLLHPRIYADSFYNTKDIPFLSLYSICLYWSARAFHTGRIKDVLLLGIFSGLLINTRIMGVMHLALLSLFYLLDCIAAIVRKQSFLPVVRNYIVLLLVTSAVLYASWPYLWTDPVHRFAEAWHNMAHFRWGADVFLNGKYIPGTELPWYYAPYWFVITTPPAYLLMGVSGILCLVFLSIKTRLRYFLNCPERNVLLALATFTLPFLAVIFLHSVVYDAWRQLFFVYPAFVVLCIWGLAQIAERSRKSIVYIAAFSLIGLQGIGMMQLHPFENIYFNPFVSKKPEQVRQYLEMDYWGLSFKQSFEYLLAHDTSSHIRIAFRERPCEANARILFPGRKIECTRIPWDTLTPNKKIADYFITNYRMHPDDFENCTGKEIHSIYVNNSRINTIFKL